MPKRLSDITHAYERTSQDLEDAQDALTTATESARVRVDAAAQERHRAYDALYAYLRDHGDEVVIAGEWAYRQERGQIARAKVTWAHHVFTEDPEPEREARYLVPTPPQLQQSMAALVAEWDMGTAVGPATSDPQENF